MRLEEGVMTLIPHDISDVMLAPVVLHVDGRLDEFGRMTSHTLRQHIAVLADLPDQTRALREASLLRALAHHEDLHGWELGLDDRGVRLTHGTHGFTLGLPIAVRDYLDGRR